MRRSGVSATNRWRGSPPRFSCRQVRSARRQFDIGCPSIAAARSHIVRRTVIAAGVLTFWASAQAGAHDFSITRVLAVLKEDGTFLVDMRVNVDALALGASPSVHTAEIAEALRALPPAEFEKAVANAQSTLARRVRIRFEAEKTAATVTFPERGRPDPTATDAVPTVLGALARLEGRIPPDATTFTFGASRAFNVVQLTIVDETTGAVVKHMLSPGADSPDYRLREVQAEERAVVLVRYLMLGFEHILPKGLDHILFVLGLFLLSAHFRPLLWQVTAFTVAHSVTLALSMAGIASLPSRIVEPLIALSIAYVAIENLFVKDLKPWRPVVVFLFGLLHGLGFAGVLRDLGMPDGRFAVALVGFNVGVEFGQLAVVALAFLAVGWFRDRRQYRPVIVRPCSLLIAVIGLYWAVQRTLAG